MKKKNWKKTKMHHNKKNVVQRVLYQKQIVHEWCLDGGCLTVWYHLTAKRRIQQNQSTSRDYQVITTIAMYLLLGKQIGLLSCK